MTTAPNGMKPQVSLIVNPGTDAQRAFWTCFADRADHRANAEAKARTKHGADAVLEWTTL